jgi:hypothetical protein
MKRFMKLFIKINSKAKNNMNSNSPPWFVSHELRLGSCLTNHFLARLGSLLIIMVNMNNVFQKAKSF